ncbi:MAG: TerC family protein, partial [Bacteroidetes bacterium]
MEFLELLFTWDGLMYFLILSLLEIVLGIDNIIFISIVTDKLPSVEQRKARNIGLTLALVVRLVLLAFVSWLMHMDAPLFPNSKWEMLENFSLQSLVLLLGGLFLIYKSTIEMHSSVSGKHEESTKSPTKLSAVITQIV